MTNQLYPTDLSDSQWNLSKEFIPGAKLDGRPRSLDIRKVINVIFYVVVGGIKWRMLPCAFLLGESLSLLSSVALRAATGNTSALSIYSWKGHELRING
jgi:hypothetical protein